MDDPGFNDVYHVGVIGKILRVFEMPGGNTTVIMQSNGPKVHLDSITKTSPYLKGIVTPIPEANDQLETDEFKALIDTCKDLTSKFIEASEKMSPDTGKLYLCKLPYCGRRKDKIAKSWRFAKPPVYAGQDLKS